MTDAGLGLVIGFAFVVAVTLGFAASAVRAAAPRALVPFAVGACAWLALLAGLALRGVLDGPVLPAFAIVGGPPLGAILLAFALPGGRRLIDALPLPTLTYLHLVRAGVGFVMFGLAIDHHLPVAMTFAGRNLDIAIGFTAPIFATLAFPGGRPARGPLRLWNLISLAVLGYLVGLIATAGNHTLVEVPFVWLPGFVVPIVLGAHLVAFRQLRTR